MEKSTKRSRKKEKRRRSKSKQEPSLSPSPLPPPKKRRRLVKKGDAEVKRREKAKELALAHIGDLLGSLSDDSDGDIAWDANVALEAFDDDGFIEYEDNEEALLAREEAAEEERKRNLYRGLRKKRDESKEKQAPSPPAQEDSSEEWAASRKRSIRELRERLGARKGNETNNDDEDAFDAVLREIEELESDDLASSDSDDSHDEAYAGRKRRRLHEHRIKKKEERAVREERERDLPFWEHEGFEENPRTQNPTKFGSIEEWNRMMRLRDEARAKKLRDKPTPDSEMVVPFLGLRSALKHHQIAALVFCLLREAIPQRGVRGGIVCDEMGSGKTLLMLSLIAFDKICGYKRAPDLDGRIFAPPTLVVCPASLVETWRAEWQKHFAPHRMKMIPLTATGGGPRANIKINELLEADVIVASYATVRNMYTTLLMELKYAMQHESERFAEWIKTDRVMTESQRSNYISACAADLRPGFQTIWEDDASWGLKQFIFGYPFCRIVFDESTKCSNDSTQAFKAATTIQAERRWLLSGTPIQNHLKDLYSQLRLLGVHKATRVLSSKKHWRRFLSEGETNLAADRKITDGATQEGIDALKRKVLNVMLMRREVHNIALVDPIGTYIKRANQAASYWDTWVQWRSEDSYQRRHPATHAFWVEKERLDAEMDADARDVGASVSAHPLADVISAGTFDPETLRRQVESGEVVFEDSDISDSSEDNEVAFEEVTEKASRDARIREAGWRSLAARKKRHIPEQVAELPAGFYWDTKQRTFMDGMRIVNAWLKKAFGFGIRNVADSLDAMRDKLREIAPNGELPADPKVREPIFDASTLRWKNGAKVAVWCGKRKVKPILLLGDMHRYERAVYRFITERAEKEMREAKENKQHGCAFVTTTFARLATSDYRFPAGAARMLHHQRGDLVPDNEPTRNYEANPAHAKQERADMKLALYQEEGVELEATEKGTFKPANEEAIEGEVTAITRQLTSLYRASEASAGESNPKKEAGGTYKVPRKPPTKAVMLLRYVQACPKDDKVLVFIDMTKPIQWLLEYLQENGVSVTFMTGEHSKMRRKKALEQFHAHENDPEESAQVFLLSLKLAYLGHNLQVANHAIFYSIWWNPMVDEQAKSRIDRMGQDKPMSFVYLALRGTIDEIVLTRAASKASLGTEVIGAHDGLIQSASSFLRPEENAGILIDTRPETIADVSRQSMDILLSEPVITFDRTAEELARMQRFRTKEGRLNRVELVNFVISDAKKLLANEYDKQT